MSKYYLTKLEEEDTSNNNINNNRNLEVEKMIEKENSIKIERFMKKYLTKEELVKFEEMKQNDDYLDTDEDDKIITPEEYISRLKNFKLNNTNNNHSIRKKTSGSPPSRKSSKKISFLMKKDKDKDKDKEEADDFDNIQDIHNKNNVYIYEYQEIIQLETGNMFGDAALSNSLSKRTATIISVVDSYFGCLNKEIYNSFKAFNFLFKWNYYKSFNYFYF